MCHHRNVVTVVKRMYPEQLVENHVPDEDFCHHHRNAEERTDEIAITASIFAMRRAKAHEKKQGGEQLRIASGRLCASIHSLGDLA